MKILCLISILFLAAIGASAQCVQTTASDPCVAVHQSILDRTSKALTELQAAQDYIATLLKQTAATDAERAAYKNLAVIAQDTITILQAGISDRDKVIELQDKALQAMADLNQKLITQLGRGKSGFQKFVATLRDILLVAAGAGLAHGL